MNKIIVLNNYSLHDETLYVQNKQKPDHLLYGINYFHKRDFQVEIIPFEKCKLLVNAQKFYIKNKGFIPIGDLDQQWSSLKSLNDADLIYAPCQTQTHILNYFRALGLLKIPIVCLAHHPLNRGKLAKFRQPLIKLLVAGTDAFPSLSQKVAHDINKISSEENKSFPVCWGPDIDFYPSIPVKGQGVIAAGMTGRDFNTLGIAASQTNIQTKIICLEGLSSNNLANFGQNVEIIIQSTKDYMKYDKLLEIYANAQVLAIPLSTTTTLLGLTSLMDALGMGKPVIMTKHPLIDLDIEAEGIGKWVEAGDINGWKEAIQFFEDNEDEAFAMGQRAKNLVMNGRNSVSFANQIMDIFEKAMMNS
ncbi:hypothetical protein PN471_08330 [Aphanizomenon sp. CS-733/32]|uniref:hypothetical protein n=1 Tax=Aphanizomenon sp. CS-733/32 TaxID=3021715 RepID=UPI00232E0128|nr:hypothetical protein [Aphanizomenon sp. CS-733/32]MDB9308644.1 hypothetical protein [Aphanizomenon sp. CS-733/32]